MTTLKRGQSLQADGIRDMMLNHDGNGSTSSMAMNSTKIWERQPYRGGSVHSSSKGTTSTHSFNDHYGVVKTKSGTGSFSTGSTKGALTTNFAGWGTSGGTQGATNGGSSSQVGELLDGTSTHTTSAIPFSDLAPNADANKWLSYAGYIISGGFPQIFAAKVCFEGSGAQTTDTDWTKVHFAGDIETDHSGNNTYMPTYGSSVLISTLNRTDAVVSTASSRIVYTWANAIPILPYQNSVTADFVYWIKFE